MSDTGWQYLLVTIGAAVGVLARVGRWRRDDGTFDVQKAVAECMTVPAISFLVCGGIAYWAPDMDVRAMAAISTLAGLAGVGAVEALALRYLQKKIDG